MIEKNKIKEGLKGYMKDFLDLLKFTVFVLIIVVPLRLFIAQPFIVNGESMLPTLENGDYLIIDEISYRLEEPMRGEVIVFRLPTNTKRFLVKRIIGLPGETVVISGSKIVITKTDGSHVQLEEYYLNDDFSTNGTWVLSEDEYFMMGDNRNNSSDSRSWGKLNKDLIIGKTFLRLFPFDNLGLTPGKAEPGDIEIALP